MNWKKNPKTTVNRIKIQKEITRQNLSASSWMKMHSPLNSISWNQLTIRGGHSDVIENSSCSASKCSWLSDRVLREIHSPLAFRWLRFHLMPDSDTPVFLNDPNFLFNDIKSNLQPTLHLSLTVKQSRPSSGLAFI